MRTNHIILLSLIILYIAGSFIACHAG